MRNHFKNRIQRFALRTVVSVDNLPGVMKDEIVAIIVALIGTAEAIKT